MSIAKINLVKIKGEEIFVQIQLNTDFKVKKIKYMLKKIKILHTFKILRKTIILSTYF